MCIGQKIDDVETLNFNNLAIKNSKEVKILGITLDRNMNFHTHIKYICISAKNQSLPRSKKKCFIMQVNDEISL